MGGPEAPSGVQRDRARRRSVLASIAAGGALGTLARYLLASVVHRSPGSFPWATFWTNVTGSFVLGLVLVLILERFPPTRYLRAFIATGFCGRSRPSRPWPWRPSSWSVRVTPLWRSPMPESAWPPGWWRCGWAWSAAGWCLRPSGWRRCCCGEGADDDDGGAISRQADHHLGPEPALPSPLHRSGDRPAGPAAPYGGGDGAGRGGGLRLLPPPAHGVSRIAGRGGVVRRRGGRRRRPPRRAPRGRYPVGAGPRDGGGGGGRGGVRVAAGAAMTAGDVVGVMAAGAIGAPARYLVDSWVGRRTSRSEERRVGKE